MTDYDQMRSALAEALDIEDTGQPWTLLVEQVWAMRQRLAALAADTPAKPRQGGGDALYGWSVNDADTPPGADNG